MAEAFYDAYTLVRLCGVRPGETLQELDEHIGSISQVPSITPLKDGSLEILTLKAYLRTLQVKLRKMHPNSTLDLKYDPFKPTKEDTEHWRPDAYMDWFMERARERIRKSWPIARHYYSYLVEHKARGKCRVFRRSRSWSGLGSAGSYWASR